MEKPELTVLVVLDEPRNKYYGGTVAAPAFREIDMGEWDGRPMREIKTRYPQAWKARGDNIGSYRPPGGESFEDLLKRSLPALSEIIRHPHGNTLIVAHAGVNRVLICSILGIPLEKLFTIQQGYACLNLLRFTGPWTEAAINRPSPESPFSHVLMSRTGPFKALDYRSEVIA